MLKAMFNEIAKRLGSDCALFAEFNPMTFRNEEFLAKYKNIGVLYVNNGNLGKLPDSAMMEINYTLELFAQVSDTVVSSAPIVLPLENFATGMSGKIYSGNNMYEFFLDVGLPTSDGTIVEGAGDRNYVRYELPLNVIFTQGIKIADNSGWKIAIDEEEYELKSVLSVVEVPQTQVETNTFVNAMGKYGAMQNESLIIATGWSVQITKLYRPAEDKAIKNCILKTPRKVVKIIYTPDPQKPEETIEHEIVFHDCSFASELGQAEVMTINASTAMRSV